MGLFDSVKRNDNDFIKYLSDHNNLEEFLWSINKSNYDFPQIIKYCGDIVMNKRKLSRHNREAVIEEIRGNLIFYINIYSELTGINKFKKPEPEESAYSKKTLRKGEKLTVLTDFTMRYEVGFIGLGINI
jgi:hypothetical protein